MPVYQSSQSCGQSSLSSALAQCYPSGTCPSRFQKFPMAPTPPSFLSVVLESRASDGRPPRLIQQPVLSPLGPLSIICFPRRRPTSFYLCFSSQQLHRHSYRTVTCCERCHQHDLQGRATEMAKCLDYSEELPKTTNSYFLIFF